MEFKIESEDGLLSVQVQSLGERLYRVSLPDRDCRVDLLEVAENLYSMICDGKSYEVDIREEGDRYEVFVKGNSYPARVLRPDAAWPLAAEELGAGTVPGEEAVKAPMSSKVVKILVQPGEPVEIDQVLLIVEAMKMEMPITSPARGKVEKILVQEGDIVTEGSLLVRLKSS